MKILKIFSQKRNKLTIVVFNNTSFSNGNPIYIDLPKEFKQIFDKINFIRFTLTQSLHDKTLFFEALMPQKTGIFYKIKPEEPDKIYFNIQFLAKSAIRHLLNIRKTLKE